MAGLGVGRVLEQAGDVRVALDVGDPRKVQVAPVGLRLPGERLLQILKAPGTFELFLRHVSSFVLGGRPFRPRQRTQRPENSIRCSRTSNPVLAPSARRTPAAASGGTS